MNDDTTGDTDERAAFVDGLRQLATFIESTPGFPVPNAWGSVYLWGDGAKSQMASAARMLGNVDKTADDFYFGIERHFGPITLTVKASRTNVCERVVTGTKIETYDVLPEGVQVTTATREVEIVEWVCPPSILALASDAEAAA
jgi:hypothetical protein